MQQKIKPQPVYFEKVNAIDGKKQRQQSRIHMCEELWLVAKHILSN